MESLHCFFVFAWIKLKFGVRDNLEESDFKCKLRNAVSVRNLKENATFLLFDPDF